jgi:arylsulfatase A-like enzyme
MKPCLFNLILFSSLLIGTSARSADRPNILFILSDDQGWADVGWHGKEIHTPNLDSLAASGAKLEQFYVQPVCSPTRAALMTGRYPMRHGLQVGVVRPWAEYGLPLQEQTLPQALRTAGYSTAICGKWHLGHFQPAYLPTARGFDHQYGHYNGAIDYFEHTRDGGFDWHRDDHVCHDEGYSTFLVAKEAARLIREQPPGKPFFLYVPFNAVHAPHQVPDKFKEPYAALPEPRCTYGGMVAAMDEAVGQIITALDEKKLRRNTLIIFCSDNGGPQPGKVTSNGPLRGGKATLYEGGVRVCAFAAWQGHIQAGSTVDQPMHIIDWYPTLLKLAGASVEQKLALDGRDIWPTLTEGKPSPHSEILLNTEPFRGAIRVGDWKLVLNGGRGGADAEQEDEVAAKKKGQRRKQGDSAETVELFNLAVDPYEKNNLASADSAKLSELRARYDVLAKQAATAKSKPKKPDFKSPSIWGEP